MKIHTRLHQIACEVLLFFYVRDRIPVMTTLDTPASVDEPLDEADALTIGRRIRQLRTTRGMTLDELARGLADPGWPFVPDTRALLARLAADGVGDYGRLTAG